MIKEVSCYIHLARDEKNHPQNGDALGRSDLGTIESLEQRSDLENGEMMFRGDVEAGELLIRILTSRRTRSCDRGGSG